MSRRAGNDANPEPPALKALGLKPDPERALKGISV
jgi:hypothetical protein